MVVAKAIDGKYSGGPQPRSREKPEAQQLYWLRDHELFAGCNASAKPDLDLVDAMLVDNRHLSRLLSRGASHTTVAKIEHEVP